jgi:uncharacterized protein (UPF0332 family)
MSKSQDYLAKAQQSLLGAESEFQHKRFDNATNRAYYACFQAAIAALIDAIVPVQSDKGGTISHQAVQSRFSGLLIKRRKLYPSSLRNVLQDLLKLRAIADYETLSISSRKATRVLRLSKMFVREIESRLLGTRG